MPTPPSTQTTSPHPEKKNSRTWIEKDSCRAKNVTFASAGAKHRHTRPKILPQENTLPPPMCVGISNSTVQIGQRISFALGFSPSSCPMYKSAAWPKPWLAGRFAGTSKTCLAFSSFAPSGVLSRRKQPKQDGGECVVVSEKRRTVSKQASSGFSSLLWIPFLWSLGLGI